MIDRIPDLDLFLRFVELDGSTEGKNHEPIRWLKSELAAARPARARRRPARRGAAAALHREAELLAGDRRLPARLRSGVPASRNRRAAGVATGT